MAYTTIDDPSAFFQTKLYTGTGSSLALTNDGNSDLQPDWVWAKRRDGTYSHALFDSSRGSTKRLVSNLTNAEDTNAQYITSFDSDGFTSGTDANLNQSSLTYVAWQWKAGGSTPTKTYKVVVVSDSGNKYRFRNSGDTATYAASAVTLDLQEGGTYIFDQSDSSNSGHPLRFSTTSNGTHGGGSEYTTGVTTSGTAGNAGAFTQITVAASTATLYYYCTQHSAMGGQVNTNSTHGQTNFDGSILSVSQANTTAGFSIVTYTGNGTSGATIGHGLNSAPEWTIIRRRSDAEAWVVWHTSFGSAQSNVRLNGTDAVDTSSSAMFNNTFPTSSLITLGNGNFVNTNTETYVAYCFSEVKGYSKFGSYTGNGNADGAFVYTGFRPAWVMVKRSNSTGYWVMFDNTRQTENENNSWLLANDTSDEGTNSTGMDFVSNGFKLRNSSTGGIHNNISGSTYIYMAFAENPFVSSKGVPTTAV